MNNTRTFNWVCISAVIAAFLICFAMASHAQAQPEVPAPVATDASLNAVAETAAAVAQPFIVSFAQSHPWLLSILAVVATLRLVFKPIVSAAEAYVRSSPSVEDDALMDKIEHSRTFKTVAWLLDYLGSIKVGPQFTAKAEGKPLS